MAAVPHAVIGVHVHTAEPCVVPLLTIDASQRQTVKNKLNCLTPNVWVAILKCLKIISFKC